MPAGADFSGLSAQERQSLETWRVMATERGLDAVIDMTGRRWDLPNTHTILGIFQHGKDRASWLLLRENTGWSVLDCTAEMVIGGTLTFDGALSLIIT